MQRTAVASSNVAEVGYDADTQTLEVAFRPDRTGVSKVYQYSPVAQEAFDDLMVPGESVGRHINALKVHPVVTCTRLVDAVAEVS